MTVWSHLPTIFKQRHALRLAGLLTLCVAFITTLLFAATAHAAPGINQTLSFQGRLLNSSGGTVADGYYNMQFKIYQDGDGQTVGTTGSPAGTPEWTENHVNNNANQGVQVKNGYFSVTLGSVTPFGSSVDWNQDTLWLSMNIADTSNSCTNFTSCNPDGEMTPMKRLSAVPYAMQAQNANTLGGMATSDLIHNQNSAQQTSSNFWISGTGRADTALQAPAVDTATAGTLTIGAVNATDITLAKDVTVAAGKTITLAGGNTASRPASPTEGMLYYDTSTKQLLVYSDGKWKSDGKSATKIVAASDSSQALKDGADYVADGTSDQTEINSALTAAAGGRVYIAEGTYTIDGSISVPNNTTLAGAGSGTTIKLKNSINANINALVATDTTTGTGITLTNFRIDGNKSNNSSGTQNGIYFINMGGGNGASARQGAKISELWISNLRSYGIMLENSNNSVLTENHINNSSMGLHLKNDVYLTVTNNVIQYNSRGIYATPLYYSTINANTIESSTAYGMLIEGSSSGNTIAGNTISTTTTAGLALSTATDNTISGNHFRNSGGSTTNEAITLNSTSTGNNLTGNGITDSSATTNNYAIHIIDSASTGNYISDNSLGGGSIGDAATTNIYANQLDASGKLINKSAAGAGIQTTTNNTTAFTVQNASGTSALTVDTTSNSVLVAGALDTTTAAAMTIGSTSASSITIGKSASNISTTLLGTVLVKPTTGNDSTTAFQIQRANGTAMFTADSTNQTITFGNAASGNYTVISTSTGTITKYGTARNTKSITLTPEFAGAVLDAQSDSACTSASNGTMTAGLDSVGRTNYYNWTSTQGTNQCYDVVVQIPVPAGFNGWQSNSIMMKTSNTGNSTYGISIIDSTGSADANYSSYATPGTLSTSWSNVATSSLSGTYTAGDYFTVKIRMSAKNNANLQLGNITLNYYSNK